MPKSKRARKQNTTPVRFQKIPAALRKHDRWVPWRKKLNKGGVAQTKVPVFADDVGANFSTAEDTPYKFYRVSDYPIGADCGIGFVLTDGVQDRDDNWLIAIDLDACVNPKTDEIEDWAHEILAHYDYSYAEISPSKTGLRQWVAVRKNLDPDQRFGRIYSDDMTKAPNTGRKAANVDVYGTGLPCYVTVTGTHVEFCSDEIKVFDDLSYFLDTYADAIKPKWDKVELPVPDSSPPAISEIEERLKDDEDAQLLIRGKFDEYFKRFQRKDRSASEAHFVLAGKVMHAARGHGHEAVEFILEHTTFGAGRVESTDPVKYTKWGWVANDVARCAEKNPPKTDAFTDDETEESAHMPEEGSVPESKKAREEHDARAAEEPWTIDLDEGFESMEEEEDDELVRGLLARGQITNIAAGPKTGKTTFVMSVLAGFGREEPEPLEGFGAPESPLKTLYLSENPQKVDFKMHRALNPVHKFPRADDRGLRLLNPAARPSDALKGFLEFLEWVAKVVRKEAFDVVVIDTLEYWVPELQDTNSAGEMLKTYRMLRAFAEATGAAVLCVSHVRKTNNESLSFSGMLGSTKIRGGSDKNLIMVRHDPMSKDKRIVLRREGRDPMGIIHETCGMLPPGSPPVTKLEGADAEPVLSFELTGSVETDKSGTQFPWMRYEPCEVPVQWLGKKDKQDAIQEERDAKKSAAREEKEAKQDADDAVVLQAFFKRAEEGDESPMSHRVLIELTAEIVESYDPESSAFVLPEGYAAPTERGVKNALGRLVEEGQLTSVPNKGKKLSESALASLGGGLEDYDSTEDF